MCRINDGGHINNFKLITDQVVTPIVPGSFIELGNNNE